MNLKPETQTSIQTSKVDAFKLLSAVAIAIISLGAFYYFANTLLVIRVVGLLVSVAVAVGIAMKTEAGGNVWEFIKESRTELHKVVWPTRTETLQTSFAVIVMVVVMGILLWLLDVLLFWVVRLITGQGG